MTIQRTHILIAVQSTVVALLYFATARLGLSLQALQGISTLIWIPSGIALAALYLWGYGLVPAIFIAATLAAFFQDIPLLPAALIASANTFSSTVTIYLLQKYTPFTPAFSTLKSNAAFLLIAVIVGAGIAPAVGIWVLAGFSIVTELSLMRVALAWWVGSALGTLLFFPLIITWRHFQWHKPTTNFLAEATWYSAFLLSISILVFWTSEEIFPSIPWLYLLLFPMFWAILRFGPRTTTLSLVFLGVMAITATLASRGPFGDPPLEDQLLFLEVFIGVVGAVFLLFLGIVEELKEANRRLEEHVVVSDTAMAKALTADRAKTDFIAILSHELRNPLAPILSALELMRLKGTSGPDMPHIVDAMLENVRRMSLLLDDLLDITRIAQHRFSLRKEIIRLQPLIERSVGMVTTAAAERRHTLTVALPEEPVYLEADALRLEQVVVNLLNNAIKYTEPGGEITIACKRQSHEIIIRVSDTGMGIPRDKLETIFEPFTQLNRDTRTRAGLGIGLSLTRRLVELHGGSITAQSEGTGTGSTFTVILPMMRAGELAEARSSGAHVQP